MGLDIEWPVAPLKNHNAPPSDLLTIQWPQQGNVLIAGLKTGYEIPLLATKLTDNQKLFIVESHPEKWAIAASHNEAHLWPIGQDIFVFKNYETLTLFFESNNDVMPPTEVIPLVDTVSSVTQTLNDIQGQWSERLSQRQLEYSNFLNQKNNKRHFASLFPTANGDKLVVEMLEYSMKTTHCIFYNYNSKEYRPRQVTPYWLMEQLINNKITDIITINKSRQDLYPLIPLECRFHILASDPIPELLEPGCQPLLSPNDRVIPLNKFMESICQEKLPNHSTALQMMPSVNQKTIAWEERCYELMAFGDAPDFIFENTLTSHPTLSTLFTRFKKVLAKSPAYVTSDDIELFFTLCEREVDCHIQDIQQRSWLLNLIRVLIVGAHNKRKTLIDLIRHQPHIPLSIVGKGWEEDKELAPYIAKNMPHSPLEALANTKIVIMGEALSEKLPSPEMIAALSCGCAVIATLNPKDPDPFDVKAITRAGNLKELEEACLDLLKDQEKAQVLAKLGKTTIEFHSKSFNDL